MSVSNNNNVNNNNNTLASIQQPAILLGIPKELIQHVFHYLSDNAADCARFEKTCKKIFQISRGPYATHWLLSPLHFLNLLSDDPTENRKKAEETIKQALRKNGFFEKLQTFLKDNKMRAFGKQIALIIDQSGLNKDLKTLKFTIDIVVNILEENKINSKAINNIEEKMKNYSIYIIFQLKSDSIFADFQDDVLSLNKKSIESQWSELGALPELQEKLRDFSFEAIDHLRLTCASKGPGPFFEEAVDVLSMHLYDNDPNCCYKSMAHATADDLVQRKAIIVFCQKVLLNAKTPEKGTGPVSNNNNV